jgi:hypothetical protein
VTPDNKSEDTTMDCSIAESAIVPTPTAISVCEPQPSFYLTTPIRSLIDFSNDQSIPNMLPSKFDEYDLDNPAKDTDKENNINHSLTSIQNSAEVKKYINLTY